MYRIVTVSLSCLDLASLHLPPPPLFPYCVSPWQPVWWFHPLPADCLLSPSFLTSPTAVYPAPSPDTSRLAWISVSSSGLSCTTPFFFPNPTEPAVVSNQNNIFKNSVNITPTNSEGLLVGYSCIQVYIVSWWRCIRERRGSPTWQFHQNLMYSFIVTSKLCLFADNRDVYQRLGGQESRQAHADRFLIRQAVALHLPAM